jgi:hypothetical protein
LYPDGGSVHHRRHSIETTRIDALPADDDDDDDDLVVIFEKPKTARTSTTDVHAALLMTTPIIIVDKCQDDLCNISERDECSK